MKAIAINEKNFNWFASRLQKFFAHEDFLVWHQYKDDLLCMKSD